jgi:glycosyltransferase involved in cell wall biosynthesis
MRILAVIDSLALGGAETQLAEAITFLAERRGHDCLVCSLHPRQPLEARIGPRVPRTYLDKISRFSLPSIIAQLVRIIRHFHPDVVYSRLPLANGITCIATRLARYPALQVAGIDTVPQMFTHRYKMRHPGVVLFRYLERFADRIVCNSDGTARAVIADGYPTKKVLVVHNGIDVTHFHPPAQRPTTNRPHLVCVASLRPEKGVERLVHILAPLLSSREATLTIVGDGPERGRIKEVITGLGLSRSVTTAGAQQDVRPALHQADVYVSAAFVEGFGIAVAEAAAAGLPSVCLAVPGGLDAVVRDGVTGYLVPENQKDLFRERVSLLCRDPALRERMGTAARNHVAQHFSLEETGKQLEHALSTA